MAGKVLFCVPQCKQRDLTDLTLFLPPYLFMARPDKRRQITLGYMSLIETNNTPEYRRSSGDVSGKDRSLWLRIASTGVLRQ